MNTLQVVAVALVVAPVGFARAEDDAAFVTLDRIDGVSRAGIEMSYVTLDPIADDVQRSGLRFETHGQSVSARTGFGMYESIPVGASTCSCRSAACCRSIRLAIGIVGCRETIILIAARMPPSATTGGAH